jgi:hypothetical protein
MTGVRGTAEEIAREQGHWEVAEFIRKWERTRTLLRRREEGEEGEAVDVVEEEEVGEGKGVGVANKVE